ncbi:MAG TPA: CoA transferase, partial [Acidimicrobiales bacterium]
MANTNTPSSGEASPARPRATLHLIQDQYAHFSTSRRGVALIPDDPIIDEAAGPLSGLRVLDLSNTPAGAQASQTLADFGAEVVHVEPPGGSPLRGLPSYPFIARGKKSMVLDLHDSAESASAREMAIGADVLIETFRPGVMERLGLGYEDLNAA